ncbi:MAG: bis(5'-nucleosyl)-tetraphosphatase (symmetrical) YqeK [Clostridia bacterium]|nr:bis(5'-nucleosyl)-tetraphosphatase (symmetrical) YqeK [Clostridia bacterium]
MILMDQWKQLLQTRLNEKRYYHSLCVAEEAKRLAEKYGADAEKAYIAGLLHDITKNAPKEEHELLFRASGTKLSVIEQKSQKLWHAISGEIYLRTVLNIDDPEILEAIRYHTTAKANIPLLSEVLYLADFTSADRDYDDVDIMRKLVDQSMDEAYAYALSYTVCDLASRYLAVHPDTVEAYNEIALRGIIPNLERK